MRMPSVHFIPFASCILALGLAAAARAEGPVHHHEAPRGGTLVVLGDEFAHLELLLDGERGELTAYVLDGEASRGVPIEQESISVEVTAEEGEPFTVGLRAVENVLTGERVGRTSQFSGRHERLAGLTAFGAAIDRLSVRGHAFERVQFPFPEGNEPATHGHGAPEGQPHAHQAPEGHDHAEDGS